MAGSSVNVSESVAKPQASAAWGIYVYFAADIPELALVNAVRSTLITFASVGSTSSVKITAMVDLPGRNTEYYIFPEKDPMLSRWPVLPDRFRSNVNSASIDTFVDFFAWSYRNCPAEKVAIICFGHGYALDDYKPKPPAQNGALNQQFSYGGPVRAAESFPGDDGNELRLLYDASHNAVLNNRDFANAVQACARLMGPKQKIQVLGLDCCNMAMAEVLSELKDSTEYVVASETALPFQAWLSAPILERFMKAPHETARAFAVDAVKDFIGSFSHSADTYVELSACNMGNFKSLEVAMGKFVDELLPAIQKYEVRRAIARAWYQDVSFVPDGLIDLASFCKNLATLLRDTEENELLKATLAVVKAVIGKVEGESEETNARVVECAEVSPGVRGRRIWLSKGLSIWFPPWIQFPGVRYMQMARSQKYLARGYKNTSFAKATGWDKFLIELYRLTHQ